jgi:hypothetical protein
MNISEVDHDTNNDGIMAMSMAIPRPQMMVVGGSAISKLTNIIDLAQAVVFIVGALMVITIIMSYLKKMWDGSQVVLNAVSVVGEKSADFVVEISTILAEGVTNVVDETTETLGEIGTDLAVGAESIGRNVAELGTTIGTGINDVAIDLGTLGTTTGNAAIDLTTAVKSMIPDIPF